MKNIYFTLTALLIVINTFSQTVTYPDIDRKVEKDIYIKAVTTTELYTQITFEYLNSKSEGLYILLYPPGSKDAYYIKSNGQSYKLLSTQNIGNYDRVTPAMSGKVVEFSARFEKLPSNTTQFDLIEGAAGTWDFYGVKLKRESTNGTQSDEEKQFRRDFKYFSTYDPDIKKWSELKESNNTFVFNINTNSDVKLFWASGKTELLRKVSKIEEGKTDDNKKYQSITLLDEKGNEIYLTLYEDNKLMLGYGENNYLMFSE
jgi:hypothetical protein